MNATSASLSGQRLPLPAAAVGPLTIGYDMAYADGGTPFTHHIESLGAHRALQGYGMLVEQAAEAFFVWRGVRPATRAVLDALTNSAYPAR